MDERVGEGVPDADNSGNGGHLVRCEITGKMVPPDDAVEFRGKLVSAEGKEILLERLRNNEELKTDRHLTRPSFWRRFLCSMLDAIVIAIVMGVLKAVFLIPESSVFDDDFSSRGYQAVLLRVVLVSLYTAVFHGMYGQTPGKMVGGFRVVNMDGTPITGRTAVVRAFWSDGYDLLPVILIVLAPDMEWVWLISALYGLANCIALIADTDYNRALHDRLAGTRTVMNR